MVMRTLLSAALALLATNADAQSSGSWDLGAQLMHSPSTSTPNSFFGALTPGVSQSALAIRASTDLLRLGRIRLRYSAQLLPLLTLNGVERYERIKANESTLYVLSGQTRAYGIGIVPIGLDISADITPRVRVQAGAGAGVTRFNQHVPVAGGRQRNFTAEWDGAILVNAGRDRWVQLGMRWKHISNGVTAWENPGVDNRMLFAGMSWRVRAPR
jgi:Lipid A 3-O-deacylase (PagL)